MSIGMHITLLIILYVATNISFKFKTLTPLSDNKISVRAVSKPSTVTAKAAQPKPVVQPPKPKPVTKPPTQKPVVKENPKPVKPKQEIKVESPKKIITPKLPPKPTPEPEPAAPPAPPVTEITKAPATIPQVSTVRSNETPAPDIFNFGGDTSDLPDFYISNARLLIMSHFNVPSYLKNSDAKCSVSFTVSRDGAISNIKVEDSTNNNILDMIALKAIQETGSLAPIPDEIKSPSLNVIVTFDFNYAE